MRCPWVQVCPCSRFGGRATDGSVGEAFELLERPEFNFPQRVEAEAPTYERKAGDSDPPMRRKLTP